MKAPITPIYFVIFPNTPFFFLPSKKIRELIDQRRATAEQLLRVIMLYTLRYEQEERNELENFIGLLFKIGFDEEMVEVMFIYYICTRPFSFYDSVNLLLLCCSWWRH